MSSRALVVLCPTRGRPKAAIETQRAFDHTRTSFGTELLFVVDADDPEYREYEAVLSNMVVIPEAKGGNMVKALNVAALAVLDDDLDEPPGALGFIGDDHRFRTNGWDAAVLAELARIEGGFVFGNDLAQQWRIPTQCFMSADIVATLGWMAPPVLTHLYVDQAWLLLGNAWGYEKISYLPGTVIEHLHPAYGKAQWDPGYERVNSGEMYARDKAAYEGWVAGAFLADLAKLRA